MYSIFAPYIMEQTNGPVLTSSHDPVTYQLPNLDNWDVPNDFFDKFYSKLDKEDCRYPEKHVEVGKINNSTPKGHG